jgi:hypothetical protein
VGLKSTCKSKKAAARLPRPKTGTSLKRLKSNVC